MHHINSAKSTYMCDICRALVIWPTVEQSWNICGFPELRLHHRLLKMVEFIFLVVGGVFFSFLFVGNLLCLCICTASDLSDLTSDLGGFCYFQRTQGALWEETQRQREAETQRQRLRQAQGQVQRERQREEERGEGLSTGSRPLSERLRSLLLQILWVFKHLFNSVMACVTSFFRLLLTFSSTEE